MAAGYQTAYGLDFEAGRLMVARMVRRGTTQIVLAGGADSEETLRVLQSVSREVKTGAAALAVSAPAVQTVIRKLRAPFASPKKAAKVWDSLLDVELPFPVESALCAYSASRIEDGGTVTLAAAIRKTDVMAWEEACREAGFEPTHCDVEALALWSQQVEEAPPARAELPRAVVWMGTDHVTIARGRGRDFMAAHVLRASPLAESSQAPAAFETLWAARARQVLSTHLEETGTEEMDVWWSGPGAKDQHLVSRLQQALPTGMALRHEVHPQPESFLARALARRAVEESGVNFKTDDLIHPARLRMQERGLRRAYLGVMAAALLVLAMNGVESMLRRNRAKSVQQQLTTAAKSIAGDHVIPGQEHLMVERAIPRRDEETRAFRAAMDPTGVEGQLLQAVTAANALKVEISRLALSAGILSIEGSASGIQAIEGLVERLRQQAWAIQSDSPGLGPDGRQQFILKGTVSHGG